MLGRKERSQLEPPSALDSGREGSHGRGDLRAGHDGKLGGSPTWRCPEPALHLAPAGGGGGADGRRQRRTGGAGVGLSGFAEPGARAATAARQEDAGSRDPQGGARTRHGVKKTAAAAAVAAEGRFAMKTVAEVIGVSRSNLIERMRERPKKRIGRPPPPDEKLVSEIKAVIVELPTYGYRRVHAIQSQASLPGDEGAWPPARSPCWRHRAAP